MIRKSMKYLSQGVKGLQGSVLEKAQENLSRESLNAFRRSKRIFRVNSDRIFVGVRESHAEYYDPAEAKRADALSDLYWSLNAREKKLLEIALWQKYYLIQK